MRSPVLPSFHCSLASLQSKPGDSGDFVALPPDAHGDGLQRVVLAAPGRSRWRQGALQTPPRILLRTAGWDGCGPFLSEGLRCIT